MAHYYAHYCNYMYKSCFIQTKNLIFRYCVPILKNVPLHTVNS